MRLYDGCPDDELKAVLGKDRETRKKIESLGFTVSYFPVEASYMAFDLNYKSVTPFKNTLVGILDYLTKTFRR